MPQIEYGWHDDEKTIILITLPEEWTWTAFNEMGDAVQAMIATVDHDVYQIFDLRASEKLPANPLQYSRRAFTRNIEGNTRMTIGIGLSPYVKSILDALRRIMPAAVITRWNLHLVNTFEEAEKLIEQDKQRS
jgi:hypothetical protein